MPAPGTCAGCNWWQMFDPVLGRGECRGNGKLLSANRVQEMITTGAALNATDACTRTGPWFWPITLGFEWCSNFQTP